MEDTQKWLTRREAADLADVHLNTIRLWERDKRVRTRKDEDGGVNATVYISREDVEAIVARKLADDPAEQRFRSLEARLSVLEDKVAAYHG